MFPIKDGPTGKELREMNLKIGDVSLWRLRMMVREEITAALNKAAQEVVKQAAAGTLPPEPGEGGPSTDR